MADNPLFIPLNAEHFDAFERGDKKVEFRGYGKRWNERTCYPGRLVVLSRGYGKSRRLVGRVRSFLKTPMRETPAVEIYASKYLDAACIGIRIQRLVINGESRPWSKSI